MFLNARLYSGGLPARAWAFGLVFAAGLLAGAALRPADIASRPLPAGTPELRPAAGGHPAEVLRVNDGDTFEARVHIWPGMQVTTRVRLRGIDAAEFDARCAEEYRLALAAREALERLLSEGSVTVSRVGFDKYGGRVVASASTRRTPDISVALLQTGLVRAYDGGRRQSWCARTASR